MRSLATRKLADTPSLALYSKTIIYKFKTITSLIAFDTVKMKGEIVFFLRCTRLPRLPSFTLLYCSKAVLQEHGSVCVFFPLLAICRCAKVFLEAKWAEKNIEKAFLFIFLCFTKIWDANRVLKIQIGALEDSRQKISDQKL